MGGRAGGPNAQRPTPNAQRPTPNAQRLLVAALLVLAALPALAAPALTHRLESATLAETLRVLEQAYGWDLKAAGEGGETARNRRARFEWRDAAPGRVLSDVGRAFDVSPRITGRGAVVFDPHPRTNEGLVTTRGGVTARLLKLVEKEERSVSVGTPRPDVRDAATLSLVFRPAEGDPQVFYGIDRVRAGDDRSRELRALVPDGGIRYTDWQPGAAPDEWPVELQFLGISPGARQLRWIEGDIVLYRSVERYRVEIPLPLPTSPREWAAGPVRLRSLDIRRDGKMLEGVLVFSSPPDADTNLDPGAQWGSPSLLARLADGSLVRLPDPKIDEAPGEYTFQALVPRTSLAAEPVALVWDVIVRSRPERRIPFRFADVPLPLAQAKPGAGAPAAGELPKTGTMMLQLQPASQAWRGELSVGLARRSGTGWGPVRWQSVEPDDRGQARLDGIEPGVYRLRLAFRIAESGDTAGRRVPLILDPETVTLTPGAVVKLSARRSTP